MCHRPSPKCGWRQTETSVEIVTGEDRRTPFEENVSRLRTGDGVVESDQRHRRLSETNRDDGRAHKDS